MHGREALVVSQRSAVVVGVVVMLTSCSAAIAQAPIGPSWTAWGPQPINNVEYAGRVSAIVCSPTDPEKYLVAGADGGIWRRRSANPSWVPLTDQMPTTAIGALAMDPVDEDVIYAGTGEANYAYHSRFGMGVYKTIDGGDTWVHLAESTFAGRCFSRIVVDWSNPSRLFAAVAPAGGFLPPRSAAKGHPQRNGPVGIFRSDDGGVSWSQVSGGLPSLAGTDIAIDPTDSQRLYACIGDIFGHPDNGIYRSTDGGQAWTRLAGGLPTTDVGRISIAVAPSMPSRLYAAVTQVATSTGGSASLRGVYRSDNGGDGWTQRPVSNYMATFGWYLNVVTVQPTNPNVVVVGGVSAHRSVDGGSTWTTVTPPHVDLHAAAWDAAGRLIVGDDGGVHRSTNLGSSWTHLNGGLGLIQFYAGLSLDPANDDVLYGGTQDNGTNKRLGPGNWIHIFGGDGGVTAVNPANPEIVFCEFQGTGSLYRSTNAGASFNLSRTGISLSDRNCFLPPYEIDPTNPQRMVYGTHRVYQSVSGGQSWTPISGDLTATATGAIHSIAIAPSNPQTIWVTTNDGNVQVTFNGGGNWSLVRQGLPGWYRVMRQVFVSPTNHLTAYLAASAFGVDQVLRTGNGGQTWSALDGDLPDLPVNVVAADVRSTVSVVYLGTEIGVYRSLDDGVKWHRYGQGLPNGPVIDLRLDPARNRLLAATQGRGAWLIDVWVPGDINGDGSIGNADIGPFVDALLDQAANAAWIIRSDINADGVPDGLDVSPFVGLLVGP